MQPRRKRRIVSLLPLAACLTIGCSDGQAPTETAAARATVRVMLPKSPASMSLIGKTDSNSEIVAIQLTDSLVQYDAALALQPMLAESWEVSDDRLTWTFHLRRGVRWHDGESVTADDVVFSVNKVREPLTENRAWAPLLANLISVTAVDEQTIRAVYSEAGPEMLEGWRVPLLPEHIAAGDEDLFTGEYARHPIGCGAFKLISFERDREIVLAANDDYWNGRPAIDRLILRIYADQRTAYQALLRGELDVMHMTSNLWQQVQSAEEFERFDSFVLNRLSVWHIGWNASGSNPFFDDARVRRALLMALDREAFAEKVALGLALPGVTTFHPQTVWADPELRAWPYDPQAAAELLEQAGWIDSDGDGVRDRDGVPFEFTLTYGRSTQTVTDHMAAWQQQAWAEIGVTAEIERIEYQTFRERRKNLQFEAAAGTFNFTPSPDQFDLYHSSARNGGYNFWGLADDEIDSLLEESRSSFDTPTRQELYRRLQARLHELQPVSVLFYFATPVIHDKRLLGLTSSPLGYMQTTQGPSTWRWSED